LGIEDQNRGIRLLISPIESASAKTIIAHQVGIGFDFEILEKLGFHSDSHTTVVVGGVVEMIAVGIVSADVHHLVVHSTFKA
jgi:hypothetical protein